MIFLVPAKFLTHTFPFTRVDFANEASVTEHPVELGGEVTDHVQVRAPRMTVEAFVTSSPLIIPSPFAIETARTFLEAAIGQLATLTIPGEGVFSSYVLEAFTHSRTMAEGRSFTLRFRHVRIAAALSVTIPARMPAPVAAVGAPTEVARGQQSVAPVPPTSALRAMADVLRSGK